MTIDKIMDKACLSAFNIVKNANYNSLDLALNRFKILSLSATYYEILNLKEKFNFEDVYEELIVQCSEYDVKIKQLFNN